MHIQKQKVIVWGETPYKSHTACSWMNAVVDARFTKKYTTDSTEIMTPDVTLYNTVLEFGDYMLKHSNVVLRSLKVENVKGYCNAIRLSIKSPDIHVIALDNYVYIYGSYAAFFAEVVRPDSIWKLQSECLLDFPTILEFQDFQVLTEAKDIPYMCTAHTIELFTTAPIADDLLRGDMAITQYKTRHMEPDNVTYMHTSLLDNLSDSTSDAILTHYRNSEKLYTYMLRKSPSSLREIASVLLPNSVACTTIATAYTPVWQNVVNTPISDMMYSDNAVLLSLISQYIADHI